MNDDRHCVKCGNEFGNCECDSYDELTVDGVDSISVVVDKDKIAVCLERDDGAGIEIPLSDDQFKLLESLFMLKGGSYGRK